MNPYSQIMRTVKKDGKNRSHKTGRFSLRRTDSAVLYMMAAFILLTDLATLMLLLTGRHDYLAISFLVILSMFGTVTYLLAVKDSRLNLEEQLDMIARDRREQRKHDDSLKTEDLASTTSSDASTEADNADKQDAINEKNSKSKKDSASNSDDGEAKAPELARSEENSASL